MAALAATSNLIWSLDDDRWGKLLNQSHGGIYMVWLVQDSVDDGGKLIGLRLQCTSAAALDLVSPPGDASEELADVLLDLRLGPEAGVRGHFLADPAPDGLVRVEVRAVGGQANEAEVPIGSGEVGPEGIAAVGRAVVPDDDQRLGMVGAQLPEEGDRGLGAAVAVELHRLDLAGLQADGRVVAGLLAVARAGRADQGRLALEDPLPAQIDIGIEVGLVHEEDLGPGPGSRGAQERALPHEDRPTLRVRLQQPFLRSLEDEAQAVQVVQTATAAERHSESLPDVPPDHLPVPIRQVDPRVSRGALDRRLHLGLLRRVEGGGGTATLLEDQPIRPACAEAGQPFTDGVRIPLQRLR